MKIEKTSIDIDLRFSFTINLIYGQVSKKCTKKLKKKIKIDLQFSFLLL